MGATRENGNNLRRNLLDGTFALPRAISNLKFERWPFFCLLQWDETSKRRTMVASHLPNFNYPIVVVGYVAICGLVHIYFGLFGNFGDLFLSCVFKRRKKSQNTHSLYIVVKYVPETVNCKENRTCWLKMIEDVLSVIKCECFFTASDYILCLAEFLGAIYSGNKRSEWLAPKNSELPIWHAFYNVLYLENVFVTKCYKEFYAFCCVRFHFLVEIPQWTWNGPSSLTLQYLPLPTGVLWKKMGLLAS